MKLQFVLQGHKYAPSDVSVASLEDEKIPLSPSILESVPEKVESVLPVTTFTDLPVANHMLSTSFVEEPLVLTVAGPVMDTSNIPVERREIEQRTEEQLADAGVDAASPQEEADPAALAEEMQQVEITTDDEKEVDTAELPVNTESSTERSNVSMERRVLLVKSDSPAEDEDQYKHLKVTLIMSEQNKVATKGHYREKLTVSDPINVEDEKMVPDKSKDNREGDSDSGSRSTTDNSSEDLNLSSFLSKSKETGSVSMQVNHTIHTFYLKVTAWQAFLAFFLNTKRQKKTLKKTRKFIVDGVEVRVTTSKIITDNDAKNEEMRFLRYSHIFISIHPVNQFNANIV